jgi:hypothetical protein
MVLRPRLGRSVGLEPQGRMEEIFEVERVDPHFYSADEAMKAWAANRTCLLSASIRSFSLREL